MLRAALACVATAIGLTLLAGASASADETLPAPVPHRPWFGPQLDVVGDTLAHFAAGLRRHASLDGRSYLFPLTADGERRLAAQARESAGAGAVAVVTLEPVDLAHVTSDDAAAFAETLADTGDATGAVFLVRFGPGMNRPGVAWGLLPHAYVHAFRAVSGAVHGSTRAAAMVWSPADATGYPFGATVPDSALRYLDTDHDHRLTARDDPYLPFYPGEAAVDWVGLDLVPPSPDATIDDVLHHRHPVRDTGTRKTFYSRFAGGLQKPMLLTTGRSGLAWAAQVAGAGRARPLLGGVLWLGGAANLEQLGDEVRAGSMTLGPVTGAVPSVSAPAARLPATPTAAADGGGGGPGFLAGVLVTLGVVVVAGIVVLQVRRYRSVPRWLR